MYTSVVVGKLQVSTILNILLLAHKYKKFIVLKHCSNSQINNVLPRPKINLSFG